MKKLINPNGKIIIITEIETIQDKVRYTNYDNGVLMWKEIAQISNPFGQCPINKDIISVEPLDWKNTCEWFAEQSVLLDKQGYSLAAQGNKNWVHNKGLSNVNTTIRVYIPYEEIGIADQLQNSLYTWMQTIITQKPYRTTGKMGIVQYLVSITQNELDILSLYSSIIIEYK